MKKILFLLFIIVFNFLNYSQTLDTINIPTDYTTLSAALDTEVDGVNFVTSDVQLTIQIDTSFVETINTNTIEFTADADHIVVIECINDCKHAGIYDNTKYVARASGTSLIVFRSPWIRFKNIQFLYENVTAQDAVLYASNINSNGNIFVEECLFKGPGSCGGNGYTEAIQFYQGSGSNNLYVINSLFYDWYDLDDAGAVVIYKAAGCSLFVYNSTFANCNPAIHRGITYGTGGPITVQNCLFYGNGINISNNETLLDSTNATDTTADGGLNSSSNRYEQQFTFIDSANDNYHISNTDTASYERGIDLSDIFTIDIDGETRPIGTYWDIGYDEGEALGCTNPTVNYSASYICTVGVAFSIDPDITGDADSITVDVALVAGLSLTETNENLGRVSGTPSETDTTTYTFTIYGCDENTNTDEVEIAVIDTTGEGCTIPAIGYGALAQCSVGVAISFDPTTLTGNYDSANISPALPQGLSFTKTGENIGRISGTPEIITDSVEYNIKIFGCSDSDSVALDLSVAFNGCKVPAVEDITPTAGHRVWDQLTEYSVYDSIRQMTYLPIDYDAESPDTFPVIIELPGNTCNAGGGPTEEYWPVMGYGMSRGEGYVWISVPWLNSDGTDICSSFWETCNGTGYPTHTVEYVKILYSFIKTEYNIDTTRISLVGFSRGSVGAALVGLADDTIAQYWNGLHMSAYGDFGQYGGDPANRISRIRDFNIKMLITCGANDGFLSNVNTYCGLLDDSSVVYTRYTIPSYDHNIRWIDDCDNVYSDSANIWLNELGGSLDTIKLDSFSVRYGLPTQAITLHGGNLGDTGFIKLNSVVCDSCEFWNRDSASCWPPSWIPRGNYTTVKIFNLLTNDSATFAYPPCCQYYVRIPQVVNP